MNYFPVINESSKVIAQLLSTGGYTQGIGMRGHIGLII